MALKRRSSRSGAGCLRSFWAPAFTARKRRPFTVGSIVRARGQGLRQQCDPRPHRVAGRRSENPVQGEPPLESCFSKTLYKGRNAVERMFCRLKDYCRIATRYDKLAANFLSAIYLAAAVTW